MKKQLRLEDDSRLLKISPRALRGRPEATRQSQRILRDDFLHGGHTSAQILYC